MLFIRSVFARTLALLSFLVFGPGAAIFAQQPLPFEIPAPEKPQIAEASGEAQAALEAAKVPQNWRRQVFAAEPVVANPVAICVDAAGAVFVCETFRQSRGIEDNRSHPEWLDDDLAAQTVADRLAYLQKHLGERLIEYTRHDDRIRRLVDTDGDGQADEATVFADRFNGPLDGSGAGVLSYRGDVFFTCIPELWRLRDDDGDGVADERQALHRGYGVRYAFRGHDLHGLCVGPDGRLYFSIGDRGYNVKTESGRFADPESGAVFRCNLDGSELEVFATGLRNPQELAFDDHGNLFTGDNNSDSGDQARWVYVVEGGDSGWRMAYQYLSDRGPFNREKIWHPYHPGQPAYIVPPVTNIADGPSGLCYYPGVGLGDDYQGRFLLCDFRGASPNSGVRTFRAQPKGAFFELVDQEQPLWNLLATDVTFGPDCALYVSDWVHGWNGEGKGRIYRFVDPLAAEDPRVAEVQAILAGGLKEHTNVQLAELLGHADQRVRRESQFELASREATEVFTRAANDTELGLARLHAIWGLEQIARDNEQGADVLAPVVALLDDSDAEVRAQAAKMLGEARINVAADGLRKQLGDESRRVRYFAAAALGKLRDPWAVAPLVKVLEENNDADPVLRHGAVMGLVGCAKEEQLAAFANIRSAAARRGAVVALRRMESPRVAEFLNDQDTSIVVEAARAIHDVPIPGGMAKLAALVGSPQGDDALMRRVLSANFRLGQAEHAQALAQYAARSDAPTNLRVESLEMLADWEQPGGRDRVLGMWRPIEPRDRELAAEALGSVLAKLLAQPDEICSAALTAAAKLRPEGVGAALGGVFFDVKRGSSLRAEALNALAAIDDPQTEAAALAALESDSPRLRSAGRSALVRVNPAKAVESLEEAVNSNVEDERQYALRVLSQMENAAAEAAISRALDKLLAGETPADTVLDVLAAAESRTSPEFAEKLARYENGRNAEDHLAAYRETLEGGDRRRGRQLFFERSELSCVRCHKIDGVGGEVGPDLTKIGVDKTREYLLESIVTPSRTIAKNFESVMIIDDDGRIQSGVLKAEDEETLQLMTAEGKLLTIDKETIEDRRVGKSAMPEDLLKQLSKFDVRDLVEYLASLR